MEVTLPDGVVHYFPSEYAFIVTGELLYISALQGWIFAMRYLDSATRSSLTRTCYTLRGNKWLAWAVVIAYSVA